MVGFVAPRPAGGPNDASVTPLAIRCAALRFSVLKSPSPFSSTRPISTTIPPEHEIFFILVSCSFHRPLRRLGSGDEASP